VVTIIITKAELGDCGLDNDSFVLGNFAAFGKLQEVSMEAMDLKITK
jgi:hypothetical protein